MIIKDERLLDEFRCKARCELCGGAIIGPADPHHVMAKGLGGGGRLDHRWNLLALCRVCHTKVHMANLTIRGRRMTREDLFMIVSFREGVSVDEIERELYRLRRLPKEAARAS